MCRSSGRHVKARRPWSTRSPRRRARFSKADRGGASPTGAFAALADAAEAGAQATISDAGAQGQGQLPGTAQRRPRGPGCRVDRADHAGAARRRGAAGAMSQPARFRGVPVSGGMAAGSLHVADAQTVGHATPEEVRAAFAAVAAERGALAERLRIAGPRPGGRDHRCRSADRRGRGAGRARRGSGTRRARRRRGGTRGGGGAGRRARGSASSRAGSAGGRRQPGRPRGQRASRRDRRRSAAGRRLHPGLAARSARPT